MSYRRGFFASIHGFIYVLHMRAIVFTLLAFLLLPQAGLAEIYKWRDASGTLHFSDQKPPDNYNPETVAIQPSTTHTIHQGNNPENEGSPEQSAEPTQAQPSNIARYRSIELTSPIHGAVIRSNNGTVTLNCAVDPPLSNEAGHKVNFFVDGVAVGTSKQCRHTLQSLSRGEHSASVAVTDAMGKTLVRAPTVKFNLLRASAL